MATIINSTNNSTIAPNTPTTTNNTVAGLFAGNLAFGDVTYCTAFGYGSQQNNTLGNYNDSFGYQSLNSLTSGGYNVCLGYKTGYAITSGNRNTAVGNGALQAETVGFYNTAIGNGALATQNGASYNTAIGHLALSSETTGEVNTAIGESACRTQNGATQNSAFGQASLENVITGSHNTCLGYATGFAYTSTESSNICVGSDVQGTIGESNTTRIGNQGSGSNQQNKCFIAGIVGVTTSNTEYVTINSSTGQLGVSAGIPSVIYTITSVNHAASPYTVLSSDQFLAVDVTAGVVTIKLPNAPTTGTVFYIKDSKGLSATSNISVTTVGGAVTIDGSTTYTMNNNYGAISVIFDGTGYEIF